MRPQLVMKYQNISLHNSHMMLYISLIERVKVALSMKLRSIIW